jgi:hypothetical protein
LCNARDGGVTCLHRPRVATDPFSVARLDLTSDTWARRDLPPLPGASTPNFVSALGWSGPRLYAWGGKATLSMPPPVSVCTNCPPPDGIAPPTPVEVPSSGWILDVAF